MTMQLTSIPEAHYPRTLSTCPLWTARQLCHWEAGTIHASFQLKLARASKSRLRPVFFHWVLSRKCFPPLHLPFDAVVRFARCFAHVVKVTVSAWAMRCPDFGLSHSNSAYGGCNRQSIFGPRFEMMACCFGVSQVQFRTVHFLLSEMRYRESCGKAEV